MDIKTRNRSNIQKSHRNNPKKGKFIQIIIIIRWFLATYKAKWSYV